MVVLALYLYRVYGKNMPTRKIIVTVFTTFYRNVKFFYDFLCSTFCLIQSLETDKLHNDFELLLFKSLQT